MAQSDILMAFTDYEHFAVTYFETQKAGARNFWLQLYGAAARAARWRGAADSQTPGTSRFLELPGSGWGVAVPCEWDRVSVCPLGTPGLW